MCQVKYRDSIGTHGTWLLVHEYVFIMYHLDLPFQILFQEQNYFVHFAGYSIQQPFSLYIAACMCYKTSNYIPNIKLKGKNKIKPNPF